MKKMSKKCKKKVVSFYASFNSALRKRFGVYKDCIQLLCLQSNCDLLNKTWNKCKQNKVTITKIYFCGREVFPENWHFGHCNALQLAPTRCSKKRRGAIFRNIFLRRCIEKSADKKERTCAQAFCPWVTFRILKRKKLRYNIFWASMGGNLVEY